VNGAPNPKEMQARLVKLSAIQNDEIYARELERLADDYAAGDETLVISMSKMKELYE
jgi:hypothetical protein